MTLRLSIDRSAFETALFGIQNVAQKRTATPILTNVRLDADSDGLQLYATDYDVGLTHRVPCDVQEAGTAALPARVLYDIVRKGTGDTVELEVDGKHQGSVRTGARSHYRLVGMDASDFPEPTAIVDADTVRIEKELFALWIRKTLFAASADESRIALAGVFLEGYEGDKLRLVATDTHRLALMEVPGVLAEPVLPEEGIILPKRALQELLRILDDDGELELSVEAPHVRIAWEGTEFVFRTVDGRFPAYRTVIPDASSHSAVVDRQALIDAIDRVSLVVTDRFKSVTMRFESDTVTLLARNPEMGEGEEQVECEYSGEPLDIGFNAQYVAAALGEISTDQVEFQLIDDVSPAVLYGEGDRSYLNVIMPMRI